MASVNSRTTESLPDLMLERGEEELRVQQVIEVGLVVLQLAAANAAAAAATVTAGAVC